uniref:Reverse transcriptase zinc-binding domain-containing protein n=1 Tax=Chenopodium quinoa TaxID=63459 RepID=A0A803N9U7_CHEQI
MSINLKNYYIHWLALHPEPSTDLQLPYDGEIPPEDPELYNELSLRWASFTDSSVSEWRKERWDRHGIKNPIYDQYFYFHNACKIHEFVDIKNKMDEIVQDPNMGDVCYWKGAKSGGFSVKPAMQLIKDDDMVTKDPEWNLAWKTPVQQRIRAFLWQIFHDKVLCNANKKLRHLINDPRTEIKKIPLGEDPWVWHLTKIGECSVRSAYFALLKAGKSAATSSSSSLCTDIWSVQTYGSISGRHMSPQGQELWLASSP